MNPEDEAKIREILNEALRGGPKQQRIVRVTGTVKLPGPVQYSMRHLSFTVEEEIPQGKSRHEVVHEICKDLGPLVAEYARADESKPLPAPPKPDQQPQGWEALPWRKGPYGEWIFADEEKAKPLLSMITATSGGKLTLGEYTYSVSQGENRQFINRIKKAASK